jgi:hypothetical protein
MFRAIDSSCLKVLDFPGEIGKMIHGAAKVD